MGCARFVNVTERICHKMAHCPGAADRNRHFLRKTVVFHQLRRIGTNIGLTRLTKSNNLENTLFIS